MSHMGGPEQTDMMIYPVQPIIEEIFKYDNCYPIQPRNRNAPGNAMIIKKSKYDADINCPETKIKSPIKQVQVDILNRILSGISCPCSRIAQEDLYTDYNHVKGSRYQQEQLIFCT